MSTWSPEDGDHEVLAYGRERPSRRPHALLAAVGLAALVLGFVVGTRVDTSSRTAAAEAADRPSSVAAGAVTKHVASLADSRFVLALYNAGDEEVTATLVTLPGWMPPLSGIIPTAISPRSWGHVVFEARPDCATYPGTVRAVRIQVRRADGLTDQIALLPRPADALREHHESMCAGPGSVP